MPDWISSLGMAVPDSGVGGRVWAGGKGVGWGRASVWAIGLITSELGLQPPTFLTWQCESDTALDTELPRCRLEISQPSATIVPLNP